MFFLALQLLLVWFGTAALSLFLVHRLVRRLPLAVAVFLALLPFSVMGKALVTAGVFAPLDIAYQAEPLASLAKEMGAARPSTPMLSDVVYQGIPWRKTIREAVKNSRLPLWNRFVLAGQPLLAVQQPAVLHPATWIGFLLPLAQAWTLGMAFGLFLAALCAYLFFRDLALDEVPACLGAVAWALCDYLRFLAGHPLGPAAAPFPLLLLGLRRLAHRADRKSVALTTAALVLIIIAGHPETLLHAIAGAGVYFFFELTGRDSSRPMRSILLSALAGAVALGLCAALLLPFREALAHSAELSVRTQFYVHEKKSLPLAGSLSRLSELVVPYIHGVSGQGVPAGMGISIAYTGTLVLSLAVAGFFARRRERWAFVMLLLLGLALWTRVPLVTDFVSRLPLFDIALNERLVFLACFGVSGLAALGAQKIWERGETRVFLGSSVALAVLVTITFFQVRPELLRSNMPSSYLLGRFLQQLLPLLVGLVLCAIAASGRQRRACLLLLAVVLIQRSAENASLCPTYPNRAFYPPLPLLDRIPRNEPVRIAAVGFYFIPNISAMYELEDVRGYEAMTFEPLVETFPLWCVLQPVWFNRVDDPTKPFLSFLNVRYVLAPRSFATPAGWSVVGSDRTGQVFENPRALPRVFVPTSLRLESDGKRRLQILASISDFRSQGVVEQTDTRAGTEDWTTNGVARIGKLDYRFDEIRFEVDAAKASVVATSVTAWPGWLLTVDEKPERLLGYNHAFLAFRVGPGRHRVRLKYKPASFTLGAAISIATLGLCVLAIGVARRRRPPP